MNSHSTSHRRRRLGLGLLALAFFISGGASAQPQLLLDEVLPMLCFPPTAQVSPPCPVPAGLDPELIAPNPTGQVRLRVFDNDTATVSFVMKGLSPKMTITAFFVHYPPQLVPPHPIFEPIGPGQGPVAFIDTPVAPTTARFTEGMGREPNQLAIAPNGNGRLFVRLDYNPLKSGQVPLVNGLTLTHQGAAPAGLGAEQPTCCADFPEGPQYEPVGGSYLREFDPVTGFQLKDERGRPRLLRSPVKPVVIALFSHIDGVTSGIIPGVPTPPFLDNAPFTTGSFHLLGLFFIAPLGMD